jgi:hypothetical chaperone protein
MSTPIAYGIDFGTTNSSIAVAYDDGAEVVPVRRGNPVLPSLVLVDQTGNQLAGEDAVEQFLITGRQGARMMASLKSFLTDDHFTVTETDWGEAFTLPELVAIILRELKRAGDRHSGRDVRRLVLGHPVLFVGAHGSRFEALQELAIERLEEAAHLAGFDEVGFLDEPTAALLGEELDEGLLMSVDFGGGTFDVSTIRVTPESGEVLSIHGAAVGGELFDSLLFDAKLAGLLGLNGNYTTPVGKRLPVPAALRRVRTIGECMQMVGDTRTYSALQTVLQWEGGDVFRTIDAIVRGGHAYHFFSAIERAKIDLSAHERSAIQFTRAGIDINQPVTQDEFSSLVAPHLDLIDGQIDKALADAGVAPDDINVVVRTGGSSRIPAFVDRLARRFGPDKLAERDAFTTVAEGLAMQAITTYGEQR